MKKQKKSKHQSPPPRMSTVLLWVLVVALFAAIPGLGVVIAGALTQAWVIIPALGGVVWYRATHPESRARRTTH